MSESGVVARSESISDLGRVLAAALDRTNDLVLIADKHQRIAFANRAYLDKTGLVLEEVLGQPVTVIEEDAQRGGILDRMIRVRGQAEELRRVACRPQPDGSNAWVEEAITPLLDPTGSCQHILITARDITESREADSKLQRTHQRYRQLFESSRDAIFISTIDGVVIDANPSFLELFTMTTEDLPRVCSRDFYGSPDERARFQELIHEAGSVTDFPVRLRRLDDTPFEAVITASLWRDGSDSVIGYQGTIRDVTESNRLKHELAQAQKLDSIGRLAAGIAHEINTPTQYVGDNTRFLSDSFSDLLSLVGTFQDVLAAAKSGAVAPELVRAAEEEKEAADLDYMMDEIPRAISQSIEGVERVTKIVRAMKEFSHPGDEKRPTDINAAIQSTATVATNEWKYVAELVTDFDEELPQIPCVPGEFNQVILNLIVNAAHAIGDLVGAGANGKGTISLRTEAAGDYAQITVEDTGIGMSAEVKARIFDPFFTTKDVGKGTGQGLSMAHSVIVQKHDGSIEVDSTPGEGTRFVIRLPMESHEHEEVVS